MVVLEKTLKSPLNNKEIKPVNVSEDQSWILTRRIDAEVEAPVMWASDAHRQLTEKVPGTGKDQGQKEKRASEDEMGWWHPRCNEHELGQTSGDSEGKGGLVYRSPRGRKESGLDWATAQQYPTEFRVLENTKKR